LLEPEKLVPEFSAELSEISAEIPVNIARSSRKIAVPNRIALIPVLPHKSLGIHAFPRESRVNAARSPERNDDASDSHRRM